MAADGSEFSAAAMAAEDGFRAAEVDEGKSATAGAVPRKPQPKRRAAGNKPPAAVRTWLRIEVTGEGNVLQADKYKLTSKLGIQTRDLRLLDPHFTTTYPSCILCRDKSIVVNLEHIKAIITTKFMLVVNPEEDSSVKFIAQLKRRLASPGQHGVGKPLPSMQDLAKAAQPLPHDMDLPFELRALEICLDELASEFDTATSELEAAAYPALDSLANKVTSPRLERVRRIKNRLVRLTTRVETVREVLEKFLEDDDDMHDLNLTANEARDLEKEMAAADTAPQDTEDLVNIKLDQHRNQLITTDLILTALTCAMAIITTVSGIFGMNLDSGLQEVPHVFNQVTIATCVGSLLMFATFVVFAWRRGLLSWS